MSHLRAIMIRCLVVTIFLVIPWTAHLWAPDVPVLALIGVVISLAGLSLGLLVWSGLDAGRSRDLPAILLRWAVILAFIAVVDLAFTAIGPQSSGDVPVVVDLLMALLGVAIFNVLPVFVGLGVGALVRAQRRPSPSAPGPAYYGYPVQQQWAYAYVPGQESHRTVDG